MPLFQPTEFILSDVGMQNEVAVAVHYTAVQQRTMDCKTVNVHIL